MDNRILKSPGGLGTDISNKVMVGKNFTGNLTSFNGKLFVFDLDNLPDPYNPYNLDANTFRAQFKQGSTPSIGISRQLVDAEQNIWDITFNPNNVRFEEEDNAHILLKILGANTIDITNFAQLFSNCTELTSVAIFNTSNIRNMNYMFSKCKSLTTIPNFDTSKVTEMEGMFFKCELITAIPLLDTSNVTNMFQMFYGSSIITIPNLNVCNVTDMNSMFEDCNSLTGIPDLNSSSVTTTYQMFFNCSELKHVPLLKTDSLVIADRMFLSCFNVESGALALYQQMSSQTTPPTNHQYTFTNCGSHTQTGAAELSQIPNDWS